MSPNLIEINCWIIAIRREQNLNFCEFRCWSISASQIMQQCNHHYVFHVPKTSFLRCALFGWVISESGPLLCWGQDKMAIFWVTFSTAFFLEWKYTNFDKKNLLEFVLNKIRALVQIMARIQPGDKPLSELMMSYFWWHICVARPQWVILTEVM